MAATLSWTRIAAAVAVLSLVAGAASAQPVTPLKAEDCDKVRRSLEYRVPFAPGFRRLKFEFPRNEQGVGGYVCRLLTLGTGAHMEGPGLQSLEDMRALIHGALTATGWKETADTVKFTEKSKHGRDVFALAKDDAICVATIVVGMVAGANPPATAKEGGKIRLGKLKPHQREWWVSVDCMGELAQPPKEAMAAPGAPAGGMAAPGAPAGGMAAPADTMGTMAEPAGGMGEPAGGMDAPAAMGEPDEKTGGEPLETVTPEPPGTMGAPAPRPGY